MHLRGGGDESAAVLVVGVPQDSSVVLLDLHELLPPVHDLRLISYSVGSECPNARATTSGERRVFRGSDVGSSRSSTRPGGYGADMEYRYLGNSGLKVSRDHLRQLAHPRLPGGERRGDAVRARRAGCRASPPSTPPTSTPTPRRRRCSARRSRASGASRWRSSPRSTGPPAPGGTNDTGLSRKHILESINGSLKRLQTDYVDLYQAHRYDTETPLEETMQAFADVVRQGKALYIGVSEWTADQIRAGRDARAGAGLPAGLEPAAVLDALAGHRGRGRARPARSSASRQIVWSPDRPGRAHRQVRAGHSRRRRGRARRTRRAAPTSSSGSCATTCSSACRQLAPVADEAGLTMAQLAVAWVLQNHERRLRDHRRLPARAGARERQGCGREARRRS